jgi:hypothetical protein
MVDLDSVYINGSGGDAPFENDVIDGIVVAEYRPVSDFLAVLRPLSRLHRRCEMDIS